MRVFGTAGHVDHGKSALILALTGINPDRLREEQERQMTIDLGFAWLTLPGGEEIGFIDVPGHRDFIDNMLAGVGGIDAALFVVAADEGVMPQTKEHLAILDLLEIEHAIVVLTKIDLVEDDQWLELIKEEVKEILNGTSLEEAAFVAVSAHSGQGLDLLRREISAVIKKSETRPDLGKPRLSIDRVFTISGFGTVVTGTLVDGVLKVGQEIEVLPKGLRGRIRGLQTHKKKVEKVVPGSRVAVNLTGIDVSRLQRGDVVVNPGTFSTTKMVDVQYHHLTEIGANLKHDQRVKVFIGAAQTMARVRVLGMDQLHPGEEGWFQLVLDDPIVAMRGDHFILRRPSPGATLGGGRVADPHPQRRHRLKDRDVVPRLQQMLRGTPGDILAQSLILIGPIKLRDAIKKSGLSEHDAEDGINELREKGEIVALESGELRPGSDLYVIHKITRDKVHSELLSILTTFHQANPLKFGILREELKSRSKLEGPVFSLILKDLIERGDIIEIGIRIAVVHHEPVLDKNQKAKVDCLLKKFDASPFSPPSVKESIADVGDELYNYLVESKLLVQVSSDVVFRRDNYELMIGRIRTELEESDTLSVAEVRDIFGTSRKFALALMEHLDAIGVTVRDGDVRRLARR